MSSTTDLLFNINSNIHFKSGLKWKAHKSSLLKQNTQKSDTISAGSFPDNSTQPGTLRRAYDFKLSSKTVPTHLSAYSPLSVT